MKLFWNNPKKRIENLQKDEKYNELLEFCSKILEKNTNNLNALEGKILALQKLNLNKDASTFCNKVLEMYPYNSDIINCIVKMSQKHD